MPLAVSGGLGVVAVLVALLSGAFRGLADSGGDVPAEETSRNSVKRPRVQAAAGGLPRPRYATATIRVETTPPGAQVLIDHQQVQTAEGKELLSPCLITVTKGPHSVTVLYPAHRDQSQQIEVKAGEQDVVFPPAMKGSSDLKQAPWFEIGEKGQAVPLATINAGGRQRDPWLSSDGLSLWFAADRVEGKGIFFSTRPSPFHDFSAPELVRVTRGRDDRVSPSVSELGLLVYAVPEKAALWGALRSGPLGPFDDKHPLVTSQKTTPVWTAAQVLGGGHHLYWVEEIRGQATSWHASRADLKRSFQPGAVVKLPGLRPCLSADGLRQYVFDGKTLVRWRRASLRGTFARESIIATLELEQYQHTPHARQFCVSDDERWMVFCDDPETGGRLYLVPLSEKPQWGPTVVGHPAPARSVVVKSHQKPKIPPAPELVGKPKKSQTKKKEPPEAAPKDPRLLPLPVVNYRGRLRELLAGRQYDEAEKFISTAVRNPALGKWQEQLIWDREELAKIRGFWKDVTASVLKIRPDTTIRIRNIGLKFVKFQDGELVLQGKAKQFSAELVMMTTEDLLTLWNQSPPVDELQGQLRVGVFLFHDRPDVSRAKAFGRLRRAGEPGRMFLERQAQRMLSEVEAEIVRGRFDRALPLMASLESQFSKTAVAKQIPGMRDELVSLKSWKAVGSRKWEQDGNAWRAAPGRARGSLLVSPFPLESFQLTLEWKTAGETGQGGVYFHYPGSGASQNRSFKVQCSSDRGVSADAFSTGALFGVVAPDLNAVKPTGKWNTLKLRVDGEKVEVVINGQRVLQTTVADPEIPARGHVALDGDFGGISYRRVLLAPLVGR